jgi:hypothetical protein
MLHYIEAGWVVTLHSEEMTGEPVNDALYEHSLAVEDKLNININLYSTGLGEVDSIVNTTVASGDNAYDVFWQYLESSSNQVLKGNCLSLDQADALNFSKPWWKKSLIDDISIGDKVYMAFGDITLYTYECMTVMTFNKRIVDMFQKADPYELVDSDEWTFDAFTTMIDGVKQDVDGNGVYGEDLVDLFALGAFPSQSYEAFFVNQGLGIIEKDENNLPVYNGFVTVAFFDAQGNQIDEMDVSLSSRSYQTSDRFLVNKYVSVKGNAASCEVTDFSEIRSSAYKEIVFQPDEDMYRDSILSGLALVIVWAIFRCLYVIPVVLPALFFKCKLYHVNQHTLIVYTGRANHYVKVNGYRVDERNSLWPFTTIVLHANTPDGDHVEISIAPLTRHISLRVNGGLQTPVR